MNTYGEILAAFDDITRDSRRYHFTQLQLDRFANRGLQETCERTRHIVAYESINAVASTLEYATTRVGYEINRVEYDGERLLPISRDSLRFADRNWATRTGTPKYYYLDEMNDSSGYQVFGLFEAPSSNLTSGIRAWITAYPAAVSGLTTTTLSTEIEIPDWAVGSVLFYMLYLAYTADTKIQNLETAALYKMLYDDLLERLILRSRSRQPKRWVSGQSSGPSIAVINRLPDRITE